MPKALRAVQARRRLKTDLRRAPAFFAIGALLFTSTLARADSQASADAPVSAVSSALSSPVSPHAEPGSTEPKRKSLGDRFGFAWAMGYGQGIQMRKRTEGRDVTDVNMLLFMPHVRFEFFDRSEHGRWYSGALDLVVEPELAINFDPSTGVGGGVTTGLRYAFRPDRKWSPYVIGLVGVGAIDYDLTSQADGFSFWLQFGLGLKRRLGPAALTADVRLYHVSNAGLRPPNEGIDMIAFTLGIETP